MTQIEINSHQKGMRCKICTGCGLCPGVIPVRKNEMHIITKASLKEEQLPKGLLLPFLVCDLGTTTIAMELFGADGQLIKRHVALNPQSIYGADVISRIQAAQVPNQRIQMQKMLRDEIEKGLQKFMGSIQTKAQPLWMILAGNTTMQYLLMGWDPDELGRAPFNVSHKEIGITSFLEGKIQAMLIPGFSAFVGGDIRSGVLACNQLDTEQFTLLVDLGTNGEIALWNKDILYVTATAAGPAFEGGVNRGIFGSDLVHAIARLREEKLVDETGLLKEPYFSSGIRIGNVCITQESIRAIQVAKAAIAAGIRILLQKAGISYEAVERVYLAGGFGYYLDLSAACEIGLLPRQLLEKSYSAGNTALAGGYAIGRRLGNHIQNLCKTECDESAEKLQNQSFTRSKGPGADAQAVQNEFEKLVRISQQIRVINLAEEENFEDCYLQHINF